MKKALLFGINDYSQATGYSGPVNNLPDCILDCHTWAGKLSSHFGFQPFIFTDKQVIDIVFEHEVLKAFSEELEDLFIGLSFHGTQVRDRDGDEEDGYDEAFCLHNGVYIDDRFKKLISQKPAKTRFVIAADCCHAGTGDRDFDGMSNIRFHSIEPGQFYHNRKRRIKSVIRNGIEYIYLAACAPNQTAASTGKGGAFTNNATEKLDSGITYLSWHTSYLKSLRRKGFDQVPQIEGCHELFQSPVFGSEKMKCFLLNLFK